MTGELPPAKRFVRAGWALLVFQLVASIGAVAVTAWAFFYASNVIDSAAPIASAQPPGGAGAAGVGANIPLPPPPPPLPKTAPQSTSPYDYCFTLPTAQCAQCISDNAAARGDGDLAPSPANCPG